eukprot:6572127-Pyramimonas_sp.AAC.1
MRGVGRSLSGRLYIPCVVLQVVPRRQLMLKVFDLGVQEGQSCRPFQSPHLPKRSGPALFHL